MEHTCLNSGNASDDLISLACCFKGSAQEGEKVYV